MPRTKPSTHPDSPTLAECDMIKDDVVRLQEAVAAITGVILARLDAVKATVEAQSPAPPKRAAPSGKRRRVKPKTKEFVIDSILDDRETRRGREYLVAWQGYPSTENTWEPGGALPPGLLRAYHSAA
jgi:hypothetical protein